MHCLTRWTRLLTLGAAAFAVALSATATEPRKTISKADKSAKPSAKKAKPAAAGQKAAAMPVAAKRPMPPARLPASLDIAAGKAHVLTLPFAARRVAVGNPLVADFTLVSASELYILGKSVGTTSLILWDQSGASRVIDLTVGANLGAFAEVLARVLPQEKGIKLSSASGSIVLSGLVSDALAADSAVNLAYAFLREIQPPANMATGSGVTSAGPTRSPVTAQPSATATSANQGVATAPRAQVINLMRIRDAQQVMLEVKIAEISKTLLDKLGVRGVDRDGLMRWNIIPNVVGGASDSSLGLLLGGGTTGKGALLEAAKNDGLVKILAEPTIVAMSGHEGKFLVGGKVFLPVNQVTGGGTSVTLEEREFGVGLKFVPTVLDAGRVSLRVASEVSEISKEPLVFSSGTTNTVLPAMTTRNVATTVQLRDSQSLVIGGLLRNNITESVRAFPLLGELPVLGALFRSSEFNSELTELVVVVSPRLVKATDQAPPLPTDAFVPPSRAQLLLEGKLEGAPVSPSSGAK
ncbi:type II and III secretion system protein family protein [Hydrogenophaga sp.]|uniref:type II and III secretion system protein family protein n=1 Tax=Hydrogenophaga sp. TaxID=1904254 RepID=UPI0035B250E5